MGREVYRGESWADNVGAWFYYSKGQGLGPTTWTYWVHRPGRHISIFGVRSCIIEFTVYYDYCMHACKCPNLSYPSIVMVLFTILESRSPSSWWTNDYFFSLSFFSSTFPSTIISTTSLLHLLFSSSVHHIHHYQERMASEPPPSIALWSLQPSPNSLLRSPDHTAVYVTPSLAYAKKFAGISGAVTVSHETDNRFLNIWNPTLDEWRESLHGS